MTHFPATTRWIQIPGGAIAVKSDDSVWRVKNGNAKQLLSEEEWAAKPVGEPEGPWTLPDDA